MLTFDGKVGFFQDWSRDQEPHTWKADGEVTIGREYDPAEMRKAREEQRREKRAAIVDAREFYSSCKPLLYGHDYLRAHGLDMTGCYGLKVDDEGWMVVPGYVRGRVVTVQRISPEGQKLFWKGAPSKGAYYPIERRGATVTVFCEGLATGLALYACLPLAQVITTFSTGNLVEVARRVAEDGEC